ncbi:hypothetical protein BG003_000012 [Podila horticola]|nr:hypothetical protein BG003_000012 [Podila horticola]
MATLQLAFTFLAFSLAANFAHASYAVCAGGKDVSTWKTVYGFHLWNDDGQQIHDYGSTPRSDYIDLGGNDTGTMTLLRVYRNGYDQRFKWPDAVCKYGHDGRFRGLFFVCYDTGNSWCAAYQDGMRIACADYLDMGPDSLSCSAAKRPTP